MYEKLDPEFKEKWVSALRSGEFEQGLHRLYLNNTYCCLGVAGELCGISPSEMENKGVFIVDPLDVACENTLLINDGILPKQIIGESTSNNIVYELTSMNDNGSSFNKIADWIEENL
jgi:hypothetical protein